MVVTDKWIKYLLRNEIKIKQRLELFLKTDEHGEYLNVSTSKSGRETENKLVKKLTDKNYIYKMHCLKCIEILYDEMQHIEYEIMTMKFRRGYSSERVGFEVGYSRATVDNIVRGQKEKLKAMIENSI